MSIFSNDQGLSPDLLEAVRKIMSGEQELEEKKKMDPVGQEDGDLDNDGDEDNADDYLMTRRKAIKKSMKKDNDDAVKEEQEIAEADFTPCPGCPHPDKCEAAGKCLKKEANESADLDKGNVDKALRHDCATHVEHSEHGVGECIPGMHTLEEDENGEGYVTHYDVMFKDQDGNPFIVEKVSVEEMKITKSESHMHKKK